MSDFLKIMNWIILFSILELGNAIICIYRKSFIFGIFSVISFICIVCNVAFAISTFKKETEKLENKNSH